MPLLTVEISDRHLQALKTIGDERGISTAEAITLAIEELRRRDFLDGMYHDFARLRASPQEWEDYRRERDEWDMPPDYGDRPCE